MENFKIEKNPTVEKEEKGKIAGSELQKKESKMSSFLSGRHSGKAKALFLASALMTMSSDGNQDVETAKQYDNFKLKESAKITEGFSSRDKHELLAAFKIFRNRENRIVDSAELDNFFTKDDPKLKLKKACLDDYLDLNASIKRWLSIQDFSMAMIEGTQFKRDGAYLKEIFDDIFPQELIVEMVEKLKKDYPEGVIYDFRFYEDLPHADKIMNETLESVVLNKPSFLSELNHEIIMYSTNEGLEIMKRIRMSHNPKVKKILRIIEVLDTAIVKKSTRSLIGHREIPGGRSRFALMDDLINGRMSVDDAAPVLENEEILFEKLINIKRNPDHVASKDVDYALKETSLRLVEKINSLHEQDDSIRFKSVEDLRPEELYTLMVYGEEEIFTSTFMGFFDRIVSKLKAENKSGEDLLRAVGYSNFRIFIKECAGFNRLGEFLETMKSEQRDAVLQKFIAEIKNSPDILKEATVVADAVSAIKDKELINKIEEIIKNEYQKIKQEKGEIKIIYGLLLGMFYENKITDDNWLKEISSKYKLADLDTTKKQSLFNSEGKNFQQYFFYDDVDGQNSFNSFISSYKNDPEWKIEKNGSFVVIKSVNKKGRNIEIYANNPGSADGTQKIKSIFSEKKVAPSVVVHRGHSFHAGKTIENINPSAALVYLGSCGGYNNINGVLKKAASTKVLATKGVGTMDINDPLLKMLNKAILEKGNIEWSRFWEKAENKFGHDKRFSSYTPPHKNLSVLFIAAYNNLKKDNK